MKRPSCRILYFCRAPVPGQVKSRLASSLGESRALAIYRCLLDYNCQVARQVGFAEVEIVTTDPQHDYFADWRRKGRRISTQQGHDLGERLMHAFRTALAETEQVILLGTDSLDIGLQQLQLACEALIESDAVIQPVTDGGYILIGLKKLHPSLFQQIDWGSERVFSQTLRAMQRQKLLVNVLEMVRDIDEPEDLQDSGLLAGFLET